jgi:hypothetical protein
MTTQDIIKAIEDLDTQALQAVTVINDLNKQIAAFNKTATALIFDDLEFTPWLVGKGAAANTGATGAVALDNQTIPGAAYPTRFVDAQGAPYANKYWYKQLGIHPDKDTFHQEESFLFLDAQSAANVQAAETDLQQDIGQTYNFGLQADYGGSGTIRIWNRLLHTWVSTGYKISRSAPLVWHVFTLDCSRDANFVYYNKVTFDGVEIVLPISKFEPANEGLPPKLNIGQQFDTGPKGLPIHAAVRNIKLIAS